MHDQCFGKKFFCLAHSVLENHQELGLSDETFRKIKELKIETKKTLIRSHADIETIGVDLMAKLWEHPAELAEINKLIDKKFDAKKDAMKKLIAAFMTLKKTLSKEQLAKAKTFCKHERPVEEKEQHCCR